MMAARAAAARRAEVRSAARAWRDAKLIDHATLERIEAAYPDERPRMAFAWKVLVFVIVTIASNALFFAAAELVRHESGPVPWIVFAAVLTAATEGLLHRGGFGDNGSAAATSFWAALYATVGCGLGFERGGNWETGVTTALLAAALAFGAAFWRWGYEAEGVIAIAAFWLLLARFANGRLLWIVLGSLAAAAAWLARERSTFAPATRRLLTALFLLSVAAVYAAINRYSLDHALVESLRPGPAAAATPVQPVFAWASALATAALPLGLIAWGLRRRKTPPLDLGLILGAISLVTLRQYVHLAPLWLLLAAGGALLVAGALALERRLRRPPGAEWRGFTASPLHGRRVSGLEAAAVVAAFAPAAAPGPERGDFTPGGGGFGGGGASGGF